MNAVTCCPARRHLFVVALVAVAALAAVALPGGAFAANDGSVTGAVIDQTTGQPVGGLEVELIRFEGNPPQQTDSATTTTAADGTYRFDGLDTSDGIVYVTSATYQHVLYSSGMITFGDGPQQNRDVAVYDTTTDSSSVSLQSRGFVLTNIDSDTGQLSVLDIFALHLDGNKTLAPAADGRTLRFSAPRNASEVTPLQGFDFGTPSIEDATVFATAPLRPGDATATLDYTIPYTGTKVSLAVDAIYPTQAVRVLIPTAGDGFSDGVTLDGEGFQDGGVVTVADKEYHLWTAGSVDPSGIIAFELQNLPDFSASSKQHTVAPIVLAALVALIAAGLTAWIVVKRGLYRQRPVTIMAAVGAPLEERRGELTARLRSLESDHQLGRIDESAYATERRSILEELRHLSRQARGIGDDE